jgi:hypothetical protein
MTLTNLPVLDGTPLESFDIERQPEEGREENDSFDTILFPLVMLGLSSPAEESNNVFGQL